MSPKTEWLGWVLLWLFSGIMAGLLVKDSIISAILCIAVSVYALDMAGAVLRKASKKE